MSTGVIENITISGFKVYGEQCDSAPTINTVIGGSSGVNIYSWQNTANITEAAKNFTVLLTNGSGYGGEAGVDTLSVMLKLGSSATGGSVTINNYNATTGVGFSSATTSGYQLPSWKVWNPQCVSATNVPTNTPSDDPNTTHMAYTVTSGGSLSGGYTVSQIKISGSFSSNYGLPTRVGNNNLNVIVKDSTGAVVGQYNFNVIVISSNTHLTSMLATPSPSGSAIYSPVFNSNYCAYENQAYTLNVPIGTTSVTLTPVLETPGNSPTASIAVSCPAVSGSPAFYQVVSSGVTTSSIPVIDDSIITVVVTAADGSTKQSYSVSVQANTGNSFLGSVAFKYNTETSTVAFEADGDHWSQYHSPSDPTFAADYLQTYFNYQYLNCLPNVNYGITASIFAADENSLVSFNNGDFVLWGRTNFFIPYSLLNQGGVTTIPVVCKSPLNSITSYTFQIWVGSNAALNKAALTNISFSSGAALATPFVAGNFKAYDNLADIATAATGESPLLPSYDVFVNSSLIGSPVNIVMTYNDYGCVHSINNNLGGWVPTQANLTNPATSVVDDNWTLGAQRSAESADMAQTLTPANTNSTLIAVQLPGGKFYGYRLRYIVPGATLANLSLYNSSNDLPIVYPAFNPIFNPTILSYDAFIGSALNPANSVKLNVNFANTLTCKYQVGTGSEIAISNAVTTLISLGTMANSYVLTINLYDGTTLKAAYTLNLLNVDASLLLSALTLKNAEYVPASGSTPAYYQVDPALPTACDSTPAFSSTTLVLEYGAGTNKPVNPYYAINPTVSFPNSQVISISVNGQAAVPVISGANFYMPSSAIDTVVVTVSDRLTPQNSNQYTMIIYNQSTNIQLKLANFANIPNGDWATALPDGVTYKTPIGTASAFGDSVSSSADTTAFTATPTQTGTLMYIVEPSGFTPLAPGVPSNTIALPQSQNKVYAWTFANSHSAYCQFTFTINKIISVNSLLNSMVLTNANPFVFNSLQYVYNGITLQSGKTDFNFVATAASSSATIVCSWNGTTVTAASGSGTGSFEPSANLTVLANVNNVLLVTVTAPAGPAYVTTYTFNITRPSTSLLSNIRVFNDETLANGSRATDTTLLYGETAVNPSPFVPTFFTYSSEVASSTNVAYVVLVKSPEASISMLNGTYKKDVSGYGTGVVAQIWAVPVQFDSITNNLVFQLNPATITVTDLVSTNVYNLSVVRSVITTVVSSISLTDALTGNAIPLRNMSGAPVSFDPNVFTYTIPASYVGRQITTSIIGANGVSNTYYLNGAIYYVPQTYVIDVSHPVTILVVSNNYLSAPSTYQISLL